MDNVRELKKLAQEDARLKKLLAERGLEIEVMKEITVKVVSTPEVSYRGLLRN